MKKFKKRYAPDAVLKMEVEFRNGLWGVCNDNADHQSREGDYEVITRLLDE